MAKTTSKSSTKPRTKTIRKNVPKTKAKVTSGNFVTSYKKFSKRKLAIIGAAFAAIGCATLIYSFAATPTQTVEAESFSFSPSQTADIVRTGSPVASMLWSTSGTKTVNFERKTVKMAVNAYSSQCGKEAAKMEVKVDGVTVLLQDVVSTTLTTYTVDTIIAPGNHEVTFSFLNDFSMKKTKGVPACDRNLYVDKFIFSGEPVLDPALSLPGSVITSVAADKLDYGSTGASYSASNGLIWSNGSAQATFVLPSATDSIVASLSGVQCDGAPIMELSVDGYTLLSGGIDSTTTKDYLVKKTHGAGTHTLKINFLNDYKTSVCDRNLLISKIDFRGTPVTTPTPTPTPSPVPSGDYSTFYVNPKNQAQVNADKIRSTRPADAALLDKIGKNGSATWIGGYSGEEFGYVEAINGARNAKATLVLVLYGVPNRDGGQYSSGGLADYTAYVNWINWAHSKLGDTSVYVIVEPDGVAMSVPDELREERMKSLNYAITKMGTLPNAKVYLDAGSFGWRTPADMSTRLKSAGVANADGFAVNVSNFQDDASSIKYGTEISNLVGGKPFVIDTSRNGNGRWIPPIGETEAWCNPPDRALGQRPTKNTGVPKVDAYLWVKLTGTSDGACRGYPNAGQWIESLALEMARNAKW